MDPGGDNGFIEGGHPLQGVRGVAGDHFGYSGEGVLLVAGVDTLRGVAHMEVLFPDHAGLFFKDMDADLFGDPGVDRGLEDHDAPFFHVLPHDAGGPLKGSEIRASGPINGGGDCHHNKVGLGQSDGIIGGGEMNRFFKLIGINFSGGITLFLAVFNDAGADIKSDGGVYRSKMDGKGEADVAKAHDGNGIFFHSLSTL